MNVAKSVLHLVTTTLKTNRVSSDIHTCSFRVFNVPFKKLFRANLVNERIKKIFRHLFKCSAKAVKKARTSAEAIEKTLSSGNKKG